MARMLRSLALLTLLMSLADAGCSSRRPYEQPNWSNTVYTSAPDSDGTPLQGLSNASMDDWNFHGK
jgi:hypothetical protein